MSETARAVCFAGPSARGIDPAHFEAAGLERLPPVRRGDVARLVQQAQASGSPPGVIVVADGVFHAEPAVSHAELCEAIDAGWRVWGVSSLGAIRAFELRDAGMQGFGEVHARFVRAHARGEDYPDDELCLMHLPAPGYEPLSEALVNVRDALERHAEAWGLSPSTTGALLSDLAGRWYGDRTPALLEAWLVAHAGHAPAASAALAAALAADPVKTRDLRDLLRQRPWRG